MKEKIEERIQHILLDPTVEITPEDGLNFRGMKHYDFYRLFIPAGNRQLCLMAELKDYRDVRAVATDLRIVGYHHLPAIYVTKPLTPTRACRVRKADIPFFDLGCYDHIAAFGLRPEDSLALAQPRLTPIAQRMVMAQIRHTLDGVTLSNSNIQEYFPSANPTWQAAVARLEALGLLTRVRESNHNNRKHFEWLMTGQRLWNAAYPYMSLPPPDTLDCNINKLIPKGIDPLDAFIVFKNSTNAEIQQRIRQGLRSYAW